MLLWGADVHIGWDQTEAALDIDINAWYVLYAHVPDDGNNEGVTNENLNNLHNMPMSRRSTLWALTLNT